MQRLSHYLWPNTSLDLQAKQNRNEKKNKIGLIINSRNLFLRSSSHIGEPPSQQFSHHSLPLPPAPLHHLTSLKIHRGQRRARFQHEAYRRVQQAVENPRRVTEFPLWHSRGAASRNPLSPWDTAIRMKRRGSQWRCRCRKLYSS